MSLDIFIGLDDVLVYTTPFSPKGRSDGNRLEIDNEIIWAFLRPSAHDILKILRENFPSVCLLTTSPKEYSHQLNSFFDLGFQEEYILSNEDLLISTLNRESDSISFSVAPLCENVSPDSVLIGSRAKYEETTRLKLKFLGTKNYYKILPFTGIETKLRSEQLLNSLLSKLDGWLQLSEQK